MSSTALPPADDTAGNGAAAFPVNGWEPRQLIEPPFVGDRTCPAAVAYDLMRDIMLDDPSRPPPSTAEFRAYLLDLYAECLIAVRGKRSISAARPVAPKRNGNSAGGAK